jgi:hypothetical protein
LKLSTNAFCVGLPQLHPAAIGSLLDSSGCELLTIVGQQGLGKAVFLGQAVEEGHHVPSGERRVDVDAAALARVIVDHFSVRKRRPYAS